ncbi:hypothetical protein AJ79_03973 [Helicocarpus griseus UAMH5409]|uniref:Uncharacterized protein n=1 Tax=Helicocarpus griseus UAMH5409 TaxID=1447875 RepID=A0A2B7XVQ8_9EURO|nr:hypothetical protein AJ79_03973 [Helicocarpus griseus UAMH5409]
MSASLPPLEFEVDGLYILLCDQGSTYTFHWMFYLAKTPGSGVIYRLINVNPADHKTWTYDTSATENVNETYTIYVALQIGSMEPALHEALGDRLAEVDTRYSNHFHTAMTCRVWALEALVDLDELGYIKLTRDTTDIEREAVSAAMVNKSSQACRIFKSRGADI